MILGKEEAFTRLTLPKEYLLNGCLFKRKGEAGGSCPQETDSLLRRPAWHISASWSSEKADGTVEARMGAEGTL